MKCSSLWPFLNERASILLYYAESGDCTGNFCMRLPYCGGMLGGNKIVVTCHLTPLHLAMVEYVHGLGFTEPITFTFSG